MVFSVGVVVNLGFRINTRTKLLILVEPLASICAEKAHVSGEKNEGKANK